MPPGKSWLSLIPGFDTLEHWVAENFHGQISHSHVGIQHLGSALLVGLVILLLSLRARQQLSQAGDDILPEAKFPPSARGVVELVMKFVLYIMQFTMPYKTALRHFPVIGSLGFFILFSNLLGLLPGFVPPTENWNTTAACATIVFVYYNGYATVKMGFGHIAHLANPVGEWWGWFLAPLFFPIELISHSVRPFSLSVRLLCNVAGDHLILAVFVTLLGAFSAFTLVPLVALGLFVAVLQTFVFLLLSSVYIGEVEANIAHHEHAHAHAHSTEHAQGAEQAAAH